METSKEASANFSDSQFFLFSLFFNNTIGRAADCSNDFSSADMQQNFSASVTSVTITAKGLDILFFKSRRRVTTSALSARQRRLKPPTALTMMIWPCANNSRATVIILLSCSCLFTELKPLQLFSLSSTEKLFESESILAELLSEFKNAVFKKCPLPQSDLKIFLKPSFTTHCSCGPQW